MALIPTTSPSTGSQFGTSKFSSKLPMQTVEFMRPISIENVLFAGYPALSLVSQRHSCDPLRKRRISWSAWPRKVAAVPALGTCSWLMAHLAATPRPPTETTKWMPVAQIVDPTVAESSLKVLKDKARREKQLLVLIV